MEEKAVEELTRPLWDAVTADPLDFQSWTYLISQVEACGQLHHIDKVFRGFLRQFPLCFGYWKKYVDISLTLLQSGSWPGHEPGPMGKVTEPPCSGVPNNPGDDRAVAIFERAVQAAPACLELWEAYLAHLGVRAPLAACRMGGQGGFSEG
ncbi:unnamed protein product, partial [Discosporangium mesarthrocarpum]